MYAAILAINNPESPIDSILYVRPFVNEPDEQGYRDWETAYRIRYPGSPLCRTRAVQSQMQFPG